jgi:hypothetical protein
VAVVPELNADCPRFECYVRAEFLHAFETGYGEYVPGICHSVTSLAGHALGFNVLLNNGAHIGRLPIHALAHKTPAEASWIWQLQLWNCFSYNVAVIEYEYLQEMRCKAWLTDGLERGGHYMFTVDYFGSADSESAGDGGWKCHHVIALDDGRFAALPNNRLCFYEPALVTPFTDKPGYKTMPRTWNVEDGGKWRTIGEGKMFYETKGEA